MSEYTRAIVFTDIVGSTVLNRTFGDEEMLRLKGLHEAAVNKYAAALNGLIIKNTGDGHLLCFQSVKNAINFCTRLHGDTGDERIRIRAGVHWGEVTAISSEEQPHGDISGNAVNYTARVMSACIKDGVAVSEAAKQSLLNKIGEKREPEYFSLPDWHGVLLKGFSGTHTLHPVVGDEISDTERANHNLFVENIRRSLSGLNKNLLDKIANVLGAQVRREEDAYSDEDLDKLVACFMDAGIESAIDLFFQLRREMLNRPASQVDKTWLHELDQLMRLVMPALMENKEVEEIVIGRKCLAPVFLPAHFCTIAEMLMAANEGREAKFKLRKDDLEFPPGELALPLQPEPGWGGNEGSEEKNLREHLSKKFNPGNADDVRRALDAHLAKHFYRADTGVTRDDGEFIKKETRNALARRQNRNDPSHYLLFRLTSVKEAGNAFINLVQGIRNDYPSILCLVLNDSPERESEERARFEDFVLMLPKVGDEGI